MCFKRSVWLILAIIFLGLIISCSDNDDNITGSETVFSMDFFPMEVGSQWTYSVHDTILDTYDTVTFTIIDTTTVFGEPGTVWVTVDRNYVPGIQFVTVVGDTVKIYYDRSAAPSRMLVFPLYLGNYWEFESVDGNEGCYVFRDSTISVTAGDFEAKGIVQSYVFEPFYGVRQNVAWLTPGVGLVKYEIIREGYTPETAEFWELLDYKIVH